MDQIRESMSRAHEHASRRWDRPGYGWAGKGVGILILLAVRKVLLENRMIHTC